MALRILGVGAHPDDVEIFFYGTLSAYQAEGNSIAWIVATDGAQGRGSETRNLARRRRNEALATAKCFGIEPIFLDRPDGGLSEDTCVGLAVEAEILRWKPHLVICHALNDYHPDHRALSKKVLDAARFRVPVLQADTMLGIGVNPTIYVDISAHFDRKLEAIAAHSSQEPARFCRAVEVWNRFRALQCGYDGCKYAEAFVFEPCFPFADIRELLPPAPLLNPLGR